MSKTKTFVCPYCKKKLVVPSSADREDAMLPHLKECKGNG